MFESIKRALLSLLVLLGMSGCGDEGVLVWLHVKSVTADLAALQVELTLDGKAATQQYEFTQGLGEIVIKLRKEQLGQGQLSVWLRGLNADRCKVSMGYYAWQFDGEVVASKPYAEKNVWLATMSPIMCPLTVEKAGDGIVTSSPAGVNCGTSCTIDVPLGKKLTLTAETATPFTASFWEGCSRINDTCEVRVTKAQKVLVRWGPEVGPKLVKVLRGTFSMGSPTGESGRGADETQHWVTLTTDFWIAETEVTQRQYRSLMGSNPSNSTGDELPVEQVSWIDAVAYCNALSVKEKLTPCYQINGPTVAWAEGLKCTGYRLPTEAEWEYAARSPATKVFAGADSVDEVAWCNTNSGNTTHAVKRKTANGRGLYDLSGNVWEWVWDWYQSNYATLPMTDPMGPAVKPTNEYRVVRGGAWIHAAPDARVARRSHNTATARDRDVGFRFVRSTP